MLVSESELRLRYATVPIPRSSANARAKPTAIFLPNVHMSLLLESVGRGAAPLDGVEQRGDADHGTSNAGGQSDVLDVLALHLTAVGCAHLRERNSQVGLEDPEGETDRLLRSTQRQPADGVCLLAVAEK